MKNLQVVIQLVPVLIFYFLISLMAVKQRETRKTEQEEHSPQSFEYHLADIHFTE
jgi:hypothetical protein